MFNSDAICIPFSIDNIKQYSNTATLEITHIDDMNIGDIRVNHLMIKSNIQDLRDIDIDINLSPVIKNNQDITVFINLCIMHAKALGLDINSRYWYLTIDQGIISNEKSTLREPGWHIDGMQGKEVPIKRNGDFQFIWSNTLMTEFCKQEFNIEGLDPDKHNVFDFLSKQVKEGNIYQYKDGSVILMHCYHVHRSQMLKSSAKPILRKFMRVSFTNTPITSKKMTINEHVTYNYPIHTTSGQIPNNLK